MSPDMSSPVDLELDLGDRGYHIVIGDGLIARAGEHMGPYLAQPRVVVVTDRNVESCALPALLDSLSAADISHHAIVLPPGEQTKDFSHLQELADKILAAGIDRKTTLVALGGGVVGDITGFAAAITLRGLDFIQIPTTLLAQVDSSVGGKTGINVSHGKNLIGAFHQPRLVLADLSVLESLPRRELLAGYAEVVKYGLINDAEFFAWCEDNGAALIEGNQDARRHAVHHSCAAKAAIVADDERETGVRALLNMGHTFGHALEAQAGYDERLMHGEAVAIGSVMAFEVSARMGLCDSSDTERIRRHFEAVGLPTNLAGIAEPSWTPERLIGHMTKDKKVDAGAIKFVLARGIGEAFITADVDMDAVAAVLTEAC